MVWLPAVTVIYCLPSSLQIPLFSCVTCFWSLLLQLVTKADTGGAEAAEAAEAQRQQEEQQQAVHDTESEMDRDDAAAAAEQSGAVQLADWDEEDDSGSPAVASLVDD
jgi:hypothetical protein